MMIKKKRKPQLIAYLYKHHDTIKCQKNQRIQLYRVSQVHKKSVKTFGPFVIFHVFFFK